MLLEVQDMIRKIICSNTNDREKEQLIKNEEKFVLGCPHYERKCKIKAFCCNKWYTCRLCHDELSNHQINREIQSPSQSCKNCEIAFAAYFCNICNLWEDKKKDIYHCQECGICRVGKGLGIDYEHCNKCKACLPISTFSEHKCIYNNLDQNCPVCFEYLFSSREPSVFMKCGHSIHSTCFDQLIQHSYQCPICCKSLGDAVDYYSRIDTHLEQENLSESLPPELKNKINTIFCNDCEKRSEAKFHYIYHKCAECGSYNTSVLK